MEKQIRKMEKGKAIFTIALALTLVVLLSGQVSAEFWSCFGKGDLINFCNPAIQDRTCGNSLCLYCIGNYDSVNKCYAPGNFNKCNQVEQTCTEGPGTEPDKTPPTITLNQPQAGEVYKKTSLDLSIVTNEKADLFLLDNINGNGRWVKLCEDCTNYFKKRTFKEGFNDVTFKARDVVDNEAFTDVSFFIDSKVPKIVKSEPKKGFASGTFSVQFTEQNPENVKLHYGNDESGFNEKTLNMDEECILDRGKYSCETFVEISQYDGEQISFWFSVEDIAGSVVNGKSTNLLVDSTFPVINFVNFTQDPKRSSSVTFFVGATELNLDEISYIDNSDIRPMDRPICSKMKNEMCQKKVTLRAGTHNIDIVVIDRAGNAVSQNIEVIV